MKKFGLLFIFILGVFSLAYCTELNSAVIQSATDGAPHIADSLSKASKPKLTLSFDYTSYQVGARKKRRVPSMNIGYFLVNNTDDTLRYTGTECLFSRFFLTDTKDITVIDHVWPHDSIKMVVILPHRGVKGFLNFKFNRIFDASFKFKIGMRLLKWETDNYQVVLNKLTQESTNVIWSNTEEVETHTRHKTYEQMVEELKAQSLKKPLWAFFPPITDADRKSYTLSIDQDKIGRLKDTTIEELKINLRKFVKKKYFYLKCPLKLMNNTSDTLRYINMSCSWLQIYQLNSNDYKIAEGAVCFKNYPIVIEVLPHQSSTVYIIILKSTTTEPLSPIKIGMSLQKYLNFDQVHLFQPEYIVLRPDVNNIIWSNEITVH